MNSRLQKSHQRCATSVQHAKLAEIYGKLDPDLSPELAQRRQRMAQYHTMLSKTALKQEDAKVPQVISDPLAPLPGHWVLDR